MRSNNISLPYAIKSFRQVLQEMINVEKQMNGNRNVNRPDKSYENSWHVKKRNNKLYERLRERNGLLKLYNINEK